MWPKNRFKNYSHLRVCVYVCAQVWYTNTLTVEHTAALNVFLLNIQTAIRSKKGSPYSITQRRVSELIPVLGSQPAGDVSHNPGGRLPLLSARPAVTPQPLRGLLPIFLFGEQRHDGCEQFV